MSEREAVIELAGVLQSFGRRSARHELSAQRDDFATVTAVNPVEIQLHHGGDTLPEDALYFDANCPPQTLEKGDVVLVIVIDNEHYVAGRGILGKKARDQQTSIDTDGAGLANGEDLNAVEERVDTLEGIRTVEGTVNADGTWNGDGFSVARPNAGEYLITFTPAFAAPPKVQLTLGNVAAVLIAKEFGGSTRTASTYRVAIVTTAAALADAPFDFEARGPA